MSESLEIRSTDPILVQLKFKAYHSVFERRVIPFMPSRDEPQTLDVDTPWGATLNAHAGDFLTSEVEAPNDYWPVDPQIFEESYLIIRAGYVVKKAITWLVPLTDIAHDPDRQVTIHSLEGATAVRAGDFFLAKGVKGEIWALPKEKVAKMITDDEFRRLTGR